MLSIQNVVYVCYLVLIDLQVVNDGFILHAGHIINSHTTIVHPNLQKNDSQAVGKLQKTNVNL